jgi:guanylate kinase
LQCHLLSPPTHLTPQARHCLLDVSAHSIRRLKAAAIHPIAIFLLPASPDVVRTQHANYTEEMARNVFTLALRVHAEFRHQFTETIPNEAFDRTYQRVVEIVRRESRDAYWAATGQRLP